MGKGCQGGNIHDVRVDREKQYTWADVRKHCTPDDAWIVLEGKVYDVTNWKLKHPGGRQILEDHAGQDATISFQMYHLDMSKTRKYLKPMQRGILSEATHTTERERAIEKDFYHLWRIAQKLNLFKPSITFQLLYFAHIILFEVIAYQIISHFGTGWLPFLAAAFCLGACWTHAGFMSHDLGHREVFHSLKLDQAMELFTMSFTAGFSASFWNEYHNRHHSKTNKYGKDPNIDFYDNFLVLGDGMAERTADDNVNKGKVKMPFHFQHRYWYFLGPPVFIPIKFQFVNILYPLLQKKYSDLIFIGLFFIKNMYLYLPHMGVLNFLLLLFVGRQILSHWFVWVALTNHMPQPKEIEPIESSTWVEIQSEGTCNLPDNYFCDWFTGGLNKQIEHHWFPTMPRENLRRIMPYVIEMSKKHNIPYVMKPTLYIAFYDAYIMLRDSGRTWYKAYYAALSGA